MSDGTLGEQEAKNRADFVCMGDIDDEYGCGAPCYLRCKEGDGFTLQDMKCIFGYESQWERVKKEATDKAAS
ncbi:hypothetical protein KAR91_59030 [Candidatus Pacearchaeota archaeon]|nr:hypothetical protein [Candidatus Pacearchaeota archaeon]